MTILSCGALASFHLFSVHAIQRDPAVYTAPDVFDPDRWAGERAARPGYQVRPSRSTMLQPKRVPLIVKARRPTGTS